MIHCCDRMLSSAMRRDFSATLRNTPESFGSAAWWSLHRASELEDATTPSDWAPQALSRTGRTGLYGFVATLQPDANFGRILAAYGGVFVAGSLAWGMVIDG